MLLLEGGEGVLITLCASSTWYSCKAKCSIHSFAKINQPTFGLVILARFFPWLIELCAELLLKIVMLLGAVS